MRDTILVTTTACVEMTESIDTQNNNESVLNETGTFRTTLDGKYSHADDALARIYGYESADELIRTLTDISRQLYLDPGRRK